jgi:chaperonin cofactor prefoldin
MLGGKSMEESHVAILLEDLRIQFKVFGEDLKGTRESLERRIDGLDHRMDGLDHRIDGLDHRIDHVAESLGGKIDDLATDMVDVKQRLTRVERVLNGKMSARKHKT